MSISDSNPIAARYFDGITSCARLVTLRIDRAGWLHIAGLDDSASFPLAAVDIGPRLGNTPRIFRLPDGATCECDHNDAVDAALRLLPSALPGRWLHVLESRWPVAVLALAVTVVVAWAAIRFGIPALAHRVALALPPGVDSLVSEQAMELFDRSLLGPSRLSEERRAALALLLDEIDIDDGHSLVLQFRHGGSVGPNAFALPSGTIVITDELVDLAADDREVLAVLAHEVGHVVHRHGLRSALQVSGVSLLVAAFTGDLTSTSSLAAGLPAALVNARYSRAFESEADRYAFDYLTAHGIPPHCFADILRRISAASRHGENEGGYLASHPSTAQRIALFRDDPGHGE